MEVLKMFSSVFSVLNFELWVQYWSETEEGRGGEGVVTGLKSTIYIEV